MAFGQKPDHTGRARGFGGVNVGIKKEFDKEVGRTKCSQTRTSIEEREALKIELRQELKEEFDAIMRDKMSSYLLDMGFKLPNDTTCKPGQDTSTGEPSTSPSKQNELLPLDLQGKTLCNLLLKDPETLSIYDVGSATAYPPVQNELVHLTAILPGHVKVEIHTIHEEFYGLPLPVPIPTFEIKVLQHGINTFVQWSLSLIKCQTEESLQPKKLKPLSPEIASNDLRSGEATQRTVLVPQMLMESLTPDCQWLATFFDSLPDGEPIAVILDHTIFHFEKDGIAWVNKEDASQFLRGAKLNISIIQVFMRLLQQDLKSKDKAFVVGWLCPEQTCETKIRKSLHETHDYVFKAVSKSVENGAKFIMAPIFQEEHWMILVICVPTCTIYQFDSARPTTTRRNVKMKTIVSFFFTRFKLNGNRVNRKEPLRKLVKCAQQRGGTECGFYTMRYMYDILSKYSEANDIDEVCMSLNEDP